MNIKYYILLLACAILLVVSCTKNYLSSESNVSLYIPQIESREIGSLTIVFHNSKGEFLHQRVIIPKSGEINSGLLKISIPTESLKGSEVDITCIADVDSDLITSNALLADSKVSSLSDPDNGNAFFPSPDYRFFRSQLKVYPLGVNAVIDTLDITDKYLHKGEIKMNFKALPEGVVGTRIRYYGLGTALHFDGKYRGESLQYKEISNKFTKIADVESFSSLFLPSNNQRNEIENVVESEDEKSEYIDMHIEFLGENGGVLGNFILSEGGEGIAGEAELESQQRQILKSRSTITYNFEGFTLMKVELSGWDDEITGGDITPM